MKGGKMPFIVYSELNTTSSMIGRAILGAEDFEEVGKISGFRHFRWGKVELLAVDRNILETDFLDQIIKTDLIIFPCSHKSAKEVASFTAHAEGNWTGEAKLGGQPRQLSFSSPQMMHKVLSILSKNNSTSLPVIYEATHHGPLLKTPSMFVEVGGSREALESVEYCTFVAKSIIDALSSGPETGTTPVLGIGGMHYADKFTRMALEKGYAFSHIMPKYYVNETDMISQAVERSSERPEKAVIEWKSIKSDERQRVIANLEDLGIGYERA